MDKPRSTLFLPAGALAVMRPFRRWVLELPTYRIAPAQASGELDVVEFHTSICPQFLMRSLERIVAPHTPYNLYLNLPVPERKTEALHVHATERGVLTRAPAWRPVVPPTRDQWREAVAAQGGRRQFSHQTLLLPGLEHEHD